MAVAELTKEKEKALDVAIKQIERAYGKGAIMRMGIDGTKVEVDGHPHGRHQPGRGRRHRRDPARSDHARSTVRSRAVRRRSACT